jgi:hypothetical protein
VITTPALPGVAPAAAPAGSVPVHERLHARGTLASGRRHQVQRQGRITPARQHADECPTRKMVAGHELRELNDAKGSRDWLQS